MGCSQYGPLSSETIKILRLTPLQATITTDMARDAHWFTTALAPDYIFWTRYWNVVGHQVEKPFIVPRQKYQVYATLP